MQTLHLADANTVVAPDGCSLQPLLATARGSTAHCTLPPGGVSRAVRHREVEEIWFFLSGRGEMWRRDPASGAQLVDECSAGLCLTIPVGVEFQFRTVGEEPLVSLCVTMPPWPGEQVATIVPGAWEPRLA